MRARHAVSRHARPHRLLRAATALAVLASAVAASGCTEVTIVTAPTGGGTSGGSGTSGAGGGGSSGSTATHDAALVGTWSHTLVFTDAAGNLQSSQTVWEFRADGSATRTVIASNLTAGIADTVATAAQWHTEGSVAVITWQPPSSGTARYDWSVSGSTLMLGGTAYARVT